MEKAIFVKDIEVTDPDSKALVTLSVFKDPVSGGMFAIDSSFLEQIEITEVLSPFNPECILSITDWGT